MPTFGQLVGKVRQQLLGYTANQEVMAELGASMTSVDTTFQVDAETIDNISQGLVEIDDELILIKGYDSTSGQVTVLGGANGRGAEGTSAASHSANALITNSPTFPRARLKEAINDTILGLYPKLLVFATTDITYVPAQYEYELPAEATDVWYMNARLVGPEKVGQRLASWNFNPKAQVTDFATGKSVQILDAVTPGQVVRVVYSKAPNTLTSNTDDFAAITGFPDRVSDLVVWGAAKRALPAISAARLQLTAIEATERAQLVSHREITSAVQTFAAMYAERLEEERDRMYAEIPLYASWQG